MMIFEWLFKMLLVQGVPYLFQRLGDDSDICCNYRASSFMVRIDGVKTSYLFGMLGPI